MSGLRPRLHDDVYAFVCAPPALGLDGLDVVASVREPEGLTLVLPAAQAEARGMEALWLGRWITLELETELELVGLTARFAVALAERGIACNVVAGARHDHLFVPVDRAEESVQVLDQLQL